MKKIRVISFLCALLMVCSICVTTISTAVFADSSTPTTQPVPTTRTYTVRHVRQTLSGSYEDESLAEYRGYDTGTRQSNISWVSSSDS